MRIRSINIGGNGSDTEINGDSISPINTSSGDVEISGSNNSNINTSSGDIEVGSDNNGNINSSSGDIKISGDNKGTLNASSGDIKIGGNSNGSIRTTSGDISLSGINLSRIITSNGKIKVGVNSGEIKTTSGKVKVTQNNGDIYTISGNVDIGDLSIKIRRSGTNMSVDGIVDITGNSIANIVSCNNVSIINGKVFIDGVEQTNKKIGSKNDEYFVEIAGVTINFNEKKYTDTNGTVIDITNDVQSPIRLEGNTIVAIYGDQTIKINENQILVSGSK